MDENKINPIPGNEPETEQELPAKEKVISEESEAIEQNEEVTVQETEEEVFSEESVETEETETEETDYYSEEAEPEFTVEETAVLVKLYLRLYLSMLDFDVTSFVQEVVL